jgi:hypothetical protein
MTLTPSEKRTLERVSRPRWSKITLYLLVLIAVCGVTSLGFAIRGCFNFSRMSSDTAAQPAEVIELLQECWLALVIGSSASVTSIFIWWTRDYGLLLKKLANKTDT